ncbi:hypothetical protein KJ765_06635 [Candidatus Micrarchaeota archaeon]|nr:hypothetical protein [Candidatus Micrarchaeota archaeon]
MKLAFIAFLGVFAFGLLMGCVQQPPSTGCTQEAKVCADGSNVGRVPPSCEFAPCPTANPTIGEELPPLPPDDDSTGEVVPEDTRGPNDELPPLPEDNGDGLPPLP